MTLSDTISTFRQALRGAQSEIDRLRTKHEDLLDQRHDIEAAPRARADYEPLVDHWIREAQARKPFSIGALWSIETKPHEALSALNRHAGSDPFDILAAWDGEKLKRLILQDAPAGMPDAERAKALAKIDAELETIEIAEELACRALETETGITTLRRSQDVDLAILLAPDAELERRRK